jgi:hypothetical protein
MAIFKNTQPIVSNGLILYLDAANPQSYISGSASWKDIMSNTTGSLTNASFSQNNISFTSLGGLLFYTSSQFNTIQTNNSLTLSVWFKNSFTGEFRDIIGINKTSGITSPFVIRQNSSGVLFYDTIVGGTRYNVQFIASNTPRDIWINAVATYGNNQINTYYNSILSQQTTTSGSIAAFTSNQFGTMDLGYGYFSGSISNVSLYNRALTQQEVIQNYNAMKGRF